MKLLKELNTLNESNKGYKAQNGNEEYAGSHEFTDDMIDANDEIHNLVRLFGSKAWKDWMKQTAENYPVAKRIVSVSENCYRLAEQLDIHYSELMGLLDEADRG
jgi:hypothetical protein